MFGDGIATRGRCAPNRSTNCNGRWGRADGSAANIERFKMHNGGVNLAFCDGHVKWYTTPAGTIDGTQCTRMFGAPAQ